MAELLPEDGFVFLGGAETVLGVTDSFKPMGNTRGIYIKAASSLEAPAPVAAKV